MKPHCPNCLKEMAKAADAGGQKFDASTEDLIRRAFGDS